MSNFDEWISLQEFCEFSLTVLKEAIGDTMSRRDWLKGAAIAAGAGAAGVAFGQQPVNAGNPAVQVDFESASDKRQITIKASVPSTGNIDRDFESLMRTINTTGVYQLRLQIQSYTNHNSRITAIPIGLTDADGVPVNAETKKIVTQDPTNRNRVTLSLVVHIQYRYLRGTGRGQRFEDVNINNKRLVQSLPK